MLPKESRERALYCKGMDTSIPVCLFCSEPQDQIGAKWDLAGWGKERQHLQIVSTISFLRLKREPQLRYAPVAKLQAEGSWSIKHHLCL